MDLQPYQNDTEPGYPTLSEFRVSRRRCMNWLVKVVGVFALSGTGTFLFGQKKKTSEDADTVLNEKRKTIGKPKVPESAAQPPSNQCSIDTTGKDSSQTTQPDPTPPGVPPVIVQPKVIDTEGMRPRGKMQPSDLRPWHKRRWFNR